MDLSNLRFNFGIKDDVAKGTSRERKNRFDWVFHSGGMHNTMLKHFNLISTLTLLGKH